ncbi:MAG: glycosyltransferase [Cytophagales bacterium]|nr:glycosyltransferase [Cytophagales bacterium]
MSFSPEEILLYLFLALAGLHLIPVLIKTLALIFTPTSPSSVENPPVTVIVCARNEEANLKELVPLLLEQDHTAYEVVIVLDRCFDESLAYMKSLEPNHPNLRTMIIDYVPDQFHPKKFGLTLAIKGAKYDWVLLTDADCRPASSSWVSGMAQHFTAERDIVLGYSPYFQEKGFLNAYIGYETFNTAYQYLSSARLGIPYMGVGRNLAYRKSLFLDNLGFGANQSITGGDDDLFVQSHANHRNTGIAVSPDLMVHSKPKQKWSEYLQQKKRHYSVSKFYRPIIIFRHLLRGNIHLLLWVSFIILAFLNVETLLVYGTMLGVLALKGIFFKWSTQKMGQGYKFWFTPFLDLAYATFTPVISTVAFFRKNIRWN